ncbi:MAG TPA: GNAT family N-acetyltransferase [Trichocoleus sp.]|jgi:N-acetylglutamate synthase-like GNAT family acetyltransferase
MLAFSMLPNGSLLRPATHQDKWQIRRLLRNFDQETTRPSQRSPFRKYLGYGILGTLAFYIVMQQGWETLFYPLAIIAVSFLGGWISTALSQDWRKYWVIEQKGQLIACAKLCNYDRYSILYNLLVTPQQRGQGLGTALVMHLSGKAVKPLYLACYPHRTSFYTRLGFEPVLARTLSHLIRHDLGLTTRSELLPMKLE